MLAATDKERADSDGAWAQSARLSFRFLFILVFVLAIGWAVSNCRQVPADSRAVVLRLRRVIRDAGPGLLLALPRPFERVILLPSADRQIEFKVDAFQSVRTDDALPTAYSAATAAAQSSGIISLDPRRNAGMLLTGDMSVVRFEATLFYQITDASAYVLSSEHIAPALERLIVASAVAVCSKRDLDTILVARPELSASSESVRAAREQLRSDLMLEVNRRLADLSSQGAGLGLTVSRVDLVPSIPADAKAAFDAVLFALQRAQRATAEARTQAQIMAQKANQDRDRILANAQALAEEKVTAATTRTAAITTLSQGMQGLSGPMLYSQLYQERIGNLLGLAGRVYTTDGADGARLILSAGSPP